MKIKFIQILFLLIVANHSDGQTYGITFQGGIEERKLLKEDFRISSFDSILRVNLRPGNRIHYYTGLNAYKEDGTTLDLLTNIEFYKKSLVFNIDRLNTNQRPVGINFQEIATWEAFRIAFFIDRFKPFARKNNQLRVLWGYGISPYYFYANIKESKISNFYRKEEQTGGITTRLLGKLIYKTKSPKFLIESVIGFNLFDFGFDHSKIHDPNLSIRQQNNSIFDFNSSFSPLIKFGVTYLMLPKKDSNSIEKTNE